MKNITVWQLKGGVGKTTISFNLAANLARKGYRTLCVDLDLQSDLTSFFESDLRRTKSARPDIMECIQKGISLKKAVYSSRFDRLKFIKGSYGTVEVPKDIMTLDRMLTEIGRNFEYCIIDCHPDNTMLSRNAIAAADLVLTPIELDEFSKNNLNLVNMELNRISDMTGRECIPQKVLVNRLKRTRDQSLCHWELMPCFLNLRYRP